MRLKADFHLHTGDDPLDMVAHSNRDMIDHAAELGFEVLAITNHDYMSHTEELGDYAASRGIVLIPGVEATIENRHVLLYSVDFWADPPRTFDDLYRLRESNPQMLVIAPHPFFPSQFCLQGKLLSHLGLFDGIEYSHFYTKAMNFNKKAVDLARRAGRALVGTSDSHFLWQMGSTYSYIETKEKSLPAVLEALRAGRVEVQTDPLLVSDVLLRIRKYPSLKVKRLARRNGYRAGGEVLSLRL
ncbi:MAG: PHP-associated domain-containing protein [Acidobacteriota bacterium]